MMSFACFNNFQTGMEVKSIRLKTNWNIVDPADRGTVLWAAIVIGWDLSLVRAWNLMVRHFTFLKKIFIYLFVWLFWVLVVAPGILDL